MKLVAIGRLKAGPERELFERYAGRIRPALTVTELAPSKGSVQEQKRKDAAALLGACPDNALIVALDEGGKTPDSLRLAEMLSRWQESGRPIHFLIGGTEGLDSSVIQRADSVISLGKLTWPHMLVRILIAEQVFRAQAINTGHPYHRESRPD
ncbi:23S rRNA (pseudouridine(1915)-N(3))-methyltransferase RlmH [Gluconobacter oxydans]|uniref:23S rRNA (pseudouridine(1915)-N(3))-methyltransferase RlmH n=1 Tax=Gluconobacter oxydans TaxID=442 RepID=UPI000784634F|nr:23S rRNA (pseudouridine(1915)-N(3))-methyltransferase RlmH [Gluconobacter oxydans]KXV15915.1 50S rRNA methyltransferase [Gluconobacter oxydans]MCP1249726.1 23S rRNA (pseudouridine(1915)-N(3))-methyltransferase RlmH [Gluconobacter oxydans]WKE47428.1 23S rRNA (pseudouridine(1915)-N(3))-methyltransferase RlmH [Gluconobacter oxydans]